MFASAVESCLGGLENAKGSGVISRSVGSRHTEPALDQSTLLTTDAEAIKTLRTIFERHQWSQSAVQKTLGREASQRLFAPDILVYERRMTAPIPLHTLIKLFILGLPVNEDAVKEAFAPLQLEIVSALGLLEQGPKGIQARVGFSFCDDLWLFHDRLASEPSQLRADHVLGISPAALTLANLTVRSPVGDALDLGTGCGVQALLAARFCHRIVATDTNPRALQFTRFNAQLNRRQNIECRLGSFFEPVENERFDLIVSNPPFVISPESEYQFRDSGLPADQVSERVVRSTPHYLKSGGRASILCSWAHWTQEEHWAARPSQWLEGSGCDMHLLRGQTQEPLSHAAHWNEGYDAPVLGTRLDHWMEYYQKLGIRAITVGAVILRRRDAPRHWIRSDELPKKFVGTCSDHLLRVVQAEDFLASLSGDEELFDHVFTMAPDQTLHQILVHEPGKFVPRKVELELEGGLSFKANVDSATVQLLRRCDGQLSLRALVTQLAEMGQRTFEQVREAAARAVRELIRGGFLVPLLGTAAAETRPLGSGSNQAVRLEPAPGSSRP